MSKAPRPVKYQPEARCKLCRLEEQDEGLWIDVHEKILHEDLSYSMVASWLNMRLEVHNAHCSEQDEIKPFNKANFSKHFNKHMPTKVIMLRHVRGKMKARREREYNKLPPGKRLAAEALLNEERPEVTAYQAMLDDISFLREIVDRFRAGLEKNPDRKIAPTEMNSIQNTMTSIMTLNNGLAKYMVSSGMTKMAVQDALDLQGNAFIEVFDNSYEVIAHKLSEDDLSLFRRTIADRLDIVVREIYQKLSRTYNLK